MRVVEDGADVLLVALIDAVALDLGAAVGAVERARAGQRRVERLGHPAVDPVQLDEDARRAVLEAVLETLHARRFHELVEVEAAHLLRVEVRALAAALDHVLTSLALQLVLWSGTAQNR